MREVINQKTIVTVEKLPTLDFSILFFFFAIRNFAMQIKILIFYSTKMNSYILLLIFHTYLQPRAHITNMLSILMNANNSHYKPSSSQMR